MPHIKGINRVLETRLWLRDAIEQGKVEHVEQLLREGTNVDGTDGVGRTALYHCLRLNDTVIAKTLISHGASVDVMDSNGVSLLFYAASIGKVDGINLLLDNGVSVQLRDHREKTALHIAAEYGNRPVLRRLLEIDRIEIDAVDQWGRTAAWYAARSSELDVLEILLLAGAAIATCDSAGHTPLHAAAMGGDRECCQTLVEGQADVNARSYAGCTPLFIAAEMGNRSVCEYLLTLEQTDKEALDWYGRRAAQRAIDLNHHATARVFVQRGVDQLNIPASFWKDEKDRNATTYYHGHQRAVFIPQLEVAGRKRVLAADPVSMQETCDTLLERQKNVEILLSSTLDDQPQWVQGQVEAAEQKLRQEVLDILYAEEKKNYKSQMASHPMRSNMSSLPLRSSVKSANSFSPVASPGRTQGSSMQRKSSLDMRGSGLAGDDSNMSASMSDMDPGNTGELPAEEKPSSPLAPPEGGVREVSAMGTRRRGSVIARAQQKKKAKEGRRPSLGPLSEHAEIDGDSEDIDRAMQKMNLRRSPAASVVADDTKGEDAPAVGTPGSPDKNSFFVTDQAEGGDTGL